MAVRLHFGLSVLLLWFNYFFLHGQPKDLHTEGDDRMILAYSFYLKQKMSLDYVLARFPTLKEYVTNTTIEWNREFLSSVNCIDSVLTIHLKNDWIKNKKALYEKFIRVDNSGIEESQARQFVDVVNDRTYGHIQSPVIETLLSLNPKYMKFPEKEFSEGYTCKFSTKDTRKSLPVNVNIIYPKSWLAVAGNNKTNIIENFISGYGLGNVSIALTMEKTKPNYTKDQLTLLLSKENMQKALQSYSKVIAYETDFTIDNCKAAAITFCSEKKEEDLKKACFVSKKYSFYYMNTILSLNFSIVSSDCDDVNKEFRKYQKLMKRIIDNVVILSQWGQ